MTEAEKVAVVVTTERGPSLLNPNDPKNPKARKQTKRGDRIMVTAKMLKAFGHQLKPVAVYEAEEKARQAAVQAEVERKAKEQEAKKAKKPDGGDDKKLTAAEVNALSNDDLKALMAKHDVKNDNRAEAIKALIDKGVVEG